VIRARFSAGELAAKLVPLLLPGRELLVLHYENPQHKRTSVLY
jgi:hypothetical protein